MSTKIKTNAKFAAAVHDRTQRWLWSFFDWQDNRRSAATDCSDYYVTEGAD